MLWKRKGRRKEMNEGRREIGRVGRTEERSKKRVQMLTDLRVLKTVSAVLHSMLLGSWFFQSTDTLDRHWLPALQWIPEYSVHASPTVQCRLQSFEKSHAWWICLPYFLEYWVMMDCHRLITLAYPILYGTHFYADISFLCRYLIFMQISSFSLNILIALWH